MEVLDGAHRIYRGIEHIGLIKADGHMKGMI